MEVSGDKKSIWISLDISPVYFHIFSKLVQALVLIYSEIFPALAVERKVLFQSYFWTLPQPAHLTHCTAPTLLPWVSTCLANWKNISKAGDFHLTTPSKPRSRNGFWSRMSPTAKVWKISYYDKCLNKFGNYVEEQRTDV
jgi:hypothetical protein